MKIYVGLFILAASAGAAMAQDTPPPAPLAPAALENLTRASKAMAETAVTLGTLTMSSSIKNSPFSAEEVNESVQTLADGNRIVHNSTSKMYRNSEGRIRRESKGGAGAVFGTTYSITPQVSIVDPVIRQKYELDAQLKTAKVYDLKAGEYATVTGAAAHAITDSKAAEELIAKLKAEGKLVPSASVAAAPVAGVYTTTFGAQGFNTFQSYPATAKPKYETKNEDLGTRDFEGVTAEGTRRTTIIPADAIGNERPIEVVYERWYSKELGVTVYSKTTDPRSGEQTYKLTNVVRSEPDPSLFSVPMEYKKVGQQGAVYRTAPARTTENVRATAPTRVVAAPRTLSTSGIKP